MRTIGQHIRDVFTLADSRELLTDPDPPAGWAARYAESCHFYFTLYLAFAIFWAALGIRQIVRHEGDDLIVGIIGLACAVGFAFIAGRYFEKGRA